MQILNFNFPRRVSTFLILSCGIFGSVISQAGSDVTPLFRDFSVIHATLKAPFAEMFNYDRQNFTEAWNAKKAFVAGELILEGRTIPVEIRLRGYTSLGKCAFPKLMLKFPKDSGRTAAQGTVFEKIAKLDLNTHCQPRPESDSQEPNYNDPFLFMRENHSEALIYKWAEILGVPTMKSRPAWMTYIDSSTKQTPLPTTTEQAFFIEHFSAFLKRVEGNEIRHSKDVFHPRDPNDEETRYEFVDLGKHPQMDAMAYAKMALFETLIGNNDWRINDHELWNVRVFEDKNGKWITVPLDFNFTAIALGLGALQFDHSSISAISRGNQVVVLESFHQKIPELLSAAKFLPEKRQDFIRSRLNGFFGSSQFTV